MKRRTNAELEAEVDRLSEEVRELTDELQVYERIGSGEAVEDEVKLLRDFIADVRLGIRDLSEYDAICGPVYR